MTRTPYPEESLEELYENAPCGYLSADPAGRITRVNQTFLELTGHDRESLLQGMRFQELMTMPGRVFFDTHFGPLLRVRGFVKEIALDLLRPGQKALPVLVNAVQIKGVDGQPAALRFTIADATERRMFEADLLEAKKRADHYKVIVEVSHDAIFSASATGEIRTWNPSAEVMFGCSQEQAMGQKAWDVLQLLDVPGEIGSLREDVLSGKTVSRLARVKNATGEIIDISISLTPHIEPPGIHTGASGIIRDITERRRLETAQHLQEVQSAQIASQETERLRISRDLHDHLGQQLTALRLGLSDFRGSLDDDLPASERFEKLQSIATQIDKDLSYVAFGLRQRVIGDNGLVPALRELVEGWSRNYEIAAEFHADQTEITLTPVAAADVYHIVQEALNNTIKYSEARFVSVIIQSGDNGLNVIVEDNGVGFDTSAPTAMRKRSGGLGLIGMRERAASLGGTLSIESSPGHGATVFLRIPT